MILPPRSRPRRPCRAAAAQARLPDRSPPRSAAWWGSSPSERKNTPPSSRYCVSCSTRRKRSGAGFWTAWKRTPRRSRRSQRPMRYRRTIRSGPKRSRRVSPPPPRRRWRCWSLPGGRWSCCAALPTWEAPSRYRTPRSALLSLSRRFAARRSTGASIRG